MTTTVTRSDLVKEARSYLGTPYHHLGRLKGVGVDCIGVVMGLAKFVGIEFDTAGWIYPKNGAGVKLNHELGRYLLIIPTCFATSGDVATFCLFGEEQPQHVGVLTDYGLLHTHAGVGKVVEHLYSHQWQKRASAAFRFKEVVDG